jgi:DNA-directed RNA polymerases I, II, and III subunit RPABC5
MIIPVRCFTCGKVLADKWRAYEKACAEEDKTKDKEAAAPKTAVLHPNFDGRVRGPILDALGITRICCRRHMLGHVDLVDAI